MSTTNSSGVCDACEKYIPNTVDWKQKEEEFKQLVDRYRGTGEEYDFVVCLTGGKDSSFALYYMSMVLKARVVAFTWDNYLIRDTAWTNIHNALKATGVDHFVYKWDENYLKRFFKATFKQMSRVCFCPLLVTLTAFPFAIEKKVPIVITGFSEGQREMNHSYAIPSQIDQKQKFNDFCSFWKKTFSQPILTHEPEEGQAIIDHIFQYVDPYTKPESKVDLYPALVPLSNYINWMKKDDLISLLEKNINYVKAADAFAHTSCMIEPIKGYLEYKRNATEIISELSTIIRSGGLTKEEGLVDMDKMSLTGKISEDDIQLFCDFIKITREEFDHFTTLKHEVANNPEFTNQRAKHVAWIMGIDQFNEVVFK